jgi:hypothetical protein
MDASPSSSFYFQAGYEHPDHEDDTGDKAAAAKGPKRKRLAKVPYIQSLAQVKPCGADKLSLSRPATLAIKANADAMARVRLFSHVALSRLILRIAPCSNWYFASLGICFRSQIFLAISRRNPVNTRTRPAVPSRLLIPGNPTRPRRRAIVQCAPRYILRTTVLLPRRPKTVLIPS